MPEPQTAETLLSVNRLKVWFPQRGGLFRRSPEYTKAVDDVSLAVRRGSTLGLVGESGSGKSTTGLAIMRLLQGSGATVDGDVTFDGQRVFGLRGAELRAYRRRVAMVFQDPLASLDPRHTVGWSAAEPLKVHGLHPGAGRRPRVAELFGLVGLAPGMMDRYPHELSGGQRQRVGIARALAVEPDLLVLDEPIASLDVSVQAQVMNLLRRLQRELGLTYIFIAHDLAAVRHVSDDVAVMYRGHVVESGPAASVYADPQHDYTKALLSAVPVPDPPRERLRERIVYSPG